MQSKEQLELDAATCAKALLEDPGWARAKEDIELALWLARRAAKSQLIARCIDPQTGAPKPNSLLRQRHPRVPVPGWTGLLEATYGLIEEGLEATGSPFSAWDWHDAKSKFGTLRLSGGPMPPDQAACFASAQRAGIDPYELGQTQKASDHATELAKSKLSAELAAMGLSGFIEINQYGRLSLTEADSAKAHELFESHPQINARIFEALVELAENITNHLCESCGKPGKTVGGGWISTCCESCTAKKTAPQTIPAPAMPIAHLALESLRRAIWIAVGSRLPGGQQDPEQTAAAAEALAPIALLAAHGLDIEAPLPQGASMVEYAHSLPEFVWLEKLGIDLLSHRGSDGRTPIERLFYSDPEKGSFAERWLISRANTAPTQPDAAPRKTL